MGKQKDTVYRAIYLIWRVISLIRRHPPFGGTTFTSKAQKEELRAVYPKGYKPGRADYCTAWFVKAADYMVRNRDIRCAFVSTSSITQGEQVAALWGLLCDRGVRLNFAYTSFPWNSEAARTAAVTCVITGFS